MLDADNPSTDNTDTTSPTPPAEPTGTTAEASGEGAPAAKKTAKKAAKRAPAKKAAKKTAETTGPATADGQAPGSGAPDGGAPESGAPQKKAAKKAAAKKSAKKATGDTSDAAGGGAAEGGDQEASAKSGAPMVLFQAPEKAAAPARKRAAKKAAAPAGDDADAGAGTADPADEGDQPKPAKKAAAKKAPAKKATAKKAAKSAAGEETADAETPEGADTAEDDAEGEGTARRRRRRGGRRRRRGAGGEDAAEGTEASEGAEGAEDDAEDGEGGSRRRRTRVRQPRNPEDEIASIGGSTRLEAKKQRRREGREAGRRRAPIVSEAEFLARREAVDRKMVIRQKADLTQIAVLEDKVLVEHYVARESQTSLIGNIYLGRVQNVLPSMEAAFIDIGKGRNAVLYAGEVNWSALGHVEGQPRKVESVLKSGQTILVQVTKDPVGHKGARLTGQISLPGRFLVYVPDGNTSGISRKLPDTERNRLKTLLKEIVPDTAGVIVRTAAEGASEEELTQDVERLTVRWAEIEKKVKAGKAPELLYGEPDLTLKVVRDLFTEDFGKLVVQGDDAWKLVESYVKDVAPDLAERLEHYEGDDDVFASYRIDEQIAKGLDRKVWLPSGGSLVIDRTEAMTVVDVNTGKFTGSGGNLEETVTKNNLEAAEEVVRQLRLRDIGGIIVIDFIDMVLESNRDLVLRRLVECLGRDRTRHQVAEVTSLGLVQMTRKRIGSGLLEAFSEDCEHCKGRGVIVHDHPIEPSNRSVGQGGGMGGSDEPRSRRSRGGRGRNRGAGEGDATPVEPPKPSPMALAGTKPHPESELIVDVEPSPALELAGHGEPSETSAEPAETSSEVEPETKGDQAPADQEAAETPAEPAAPVVVTTTRRRRAAGRPAGPAVTPTEAVSVPEAASAPDAEAEDEAAPVADQEPVAEAETSDAPENADSGAESGDESDAAEESAAPVFHVPVKKRGARKR